MKICMMTNTFLPHVGGVARSIQTFSENYLKLGHEVLIVAPTFSSDEKVPEEIESHTERLAAIEQFNGTDFSVRLPLTGLYNDRIWNFEPQIIHSHHPFLIGDTALRLGAAKHVPVVFTHHTLYEEYTHYVPFDSTALKQFTIELSTQYANLCDGVVAPSESIAKLIQDRGVLTPIKVIPTGIDLERFSSGDGRKFRKENGIATERLVVGHVGRLAPEKNLEYLAQSVCRFLKGSPQALFVVVGGGPSEAVIRTVFETEGLTAQLMLVGKKTGQALYDAYRGMNVFAFSSFSETQGMVLAEAMAAGLPVVALDASGVREVVRNDKNGFLLPSDSPFDEFAAKLKLVAEDGLLRERFREGTRRTAQKFSRENSAASAIEFYEEVRTRTRPERRQEREDMWVALVKRLEVEWALISEKAKCAFNALSATDENGEEE